MRLKGEAPVHVSIVRSSAELRCFVQLPAQIHREEERWVPPLFAHEARLFRRDVNKASTYCDFVLALAWQQGRPVGRIAGIVNRRHDALSRSRTARFGFFDCVDDGVVACTLLEFVERWATSQGQERVVGPMGFTDQDPEGLLVEGFGQAPALATNHQPPYLASLVELAGYVKDVDYVTYRVPVRIPERVARVADRIVAQRRYHLCTFTKRRELKPYAMPLLTLMNHTFSGLYGFVPLEHDEMVELSRQYLRLLDPRFIKVILHRDQPVAFVIAMPNLSEGFRRARGHLYPFGLVHLWRASRRTKQLDLLLGGVHHEHRACGLVALLGVMIVREALKGGFELIDSHHILETNARMRRECERWGGTVYKRHRIFEKQLQSRST